MLGHRLKDPYPLGHFRVLGLYSPPYKFNRGGNTSNQKNNLRNAIAEQINMNAPLELSNLIVVLRERIQRSRSQ